MKKVFLDDLPLYRNSIFWKESVGYKVKFIYEDIKGEIEIINYELINKKPCLTVKYENKIHKLLSDHLKNCNIGELLFQNKLYKYNIGDIVETKTGEIKILEQIKIKYKYFQKGYKYICLKDNYIGKISEVKLLENKGCPVCSNRKIIKGLNDIATINPDLIKYFVNQNESFMYSYASEKRLKFKCPDCGYEKKMLISDLCYNGFKCNKCSDGFSFPERFMLSLLEQLTNDFELQKVFKWAKNKKYDFYINNIDTIIEVHGLQHYYKGFRNKTLEEEQKNDELKKELAEKNNINHYIIIDARFSNVKYIKNSIYNSELNSLFDLSIINWEKCGTDASNNLLKIACELWCKGIHNTKEIANIMKLSRFTIIRYLKMGTLINICDYDPKKVLKLSSHNNGLKGKKVICLNNNRIYQSIKEASLDTKIGINSISKCCNNKIDSIKNYKFKFYDNYKKEII